MFSIIVLVILGLSIGLPLGLLLNKSSSSNAPAPAPIPTTTIQQPITETPKTKTLGWYDLRKNKVDLRYIYRIKDGYGNVSIMDLADINYKYIHWAYNETNPNYDLRLIQKNSNNTKMLSRLQKEIDSDNEYAYYRTNQVVIPEPETEPNTLNITSYYYGMF